VGTRGSASWTGFSSRCFSRTHPSVSSQRDRKSGGADRLQISGKSRGLANPLKTYRREIGSSPRWGMPLLLRPRSFIRRAERSPVQVLAPAAAFPVSRALGVPLLSFFVGTATLVVGARLSWSFLAGSRRAGPPSEDSATLAVGSAGRLIIGDAWTIDPPLDPWESWKPRGGKSQAPMEVDPSIILRSLACRLLPLWQAKASP